MHPEMFNCLLPRSQEYLRDATLHQLFFFIKHWQLSQQYLLVLEKQMAFTGVLDGVRILTLSGMLTGSSIPETTSQCLEFGSFVENWYEIRFIHRKKL